MARSLLRMPEASKGPLPRHAYRDQALFHGGLAVIIVVVSWLTGSDVGKALVIAVAYFFAATLWSWWRFRERARRLENTQEEQ